MIDRASAVNAVSIRKKGRGMESYSGGISESNAFRSMPIFLFLYA
jgi:hypothetical protein